MILDTKDCLPSRMGTALWNPSLAKLPKLPCRHVLGEYRCGIRQSRDRARYVAWLAQAVLSIDAPRLGYLQVVGELGRTNGRIDAGVKRLSGVVVQ